DISQATAGASVGGLAGDGHVAFGSKTLTFAGGTSVFGGSFGDGGIGGGTGGSLLLASGSLTLTGANPFTGNPVDLFVNAGGSLGIAASVQSAVIGELYGNGNIDLDGSALSVAGGAFDGAIGGDGGGLHVGSGSLDLGGTNTYTGATMIAGGASLALTGAGSIAGSSGVTVDGTFDIGGTDGGATINR